MNKGSHLLQKINSEILIFSILIGLPVINSDYGPSISSLIRSSSSSLTSTQDPSSFPKVDPVRRSSDSILDLENFPNFAKVLPLTEDRSWMKSEELLQILGGNSSNEDYSQFIVKAPTGYGIMVVIQELQIPAFNTFNQSLLIIDDNGKILECFSKFIFQIEGKFPVEVCGRTHDDLSFRSSLIDGVGPRSFVVPIGKSISVGFVYRDKTIDQSILLSKQVPYYDMGYIFRASIAFTAYKACPHGPPFYNQNNQKLWPCDIPQSSREAVAACIQEDLFCDKIINCGMHDSKEFAIDERFCVGEPISNNASSSNASFSLDSSRQSHAMVDNVRLEEAIRNRVIQRPFDYNENMLINMGIQGGHHFSPQPVEKGDSLGHPVVVILIILITVICVLIVGLIFRFCCKPCVGKSDPFGDSSNPEAVARFHENLRNRTTDSNGQPTRAYGVTFENLFKPVEDLPPSYDDLFPEDITLDNLSDRKLSSLVTSSQIGESTITNESTTERVSERPPSTAVYSVPVSVVEQPTSQSINAIHHNNNQSYFINPAFIQMEGNIDTSTYETRNDPLIITFNNESNSSNYQSFHTYRESRNSSQNT